jgi:ferredoxin
VTFVITETCIDTTDQACVSVCPVDCIHFEEGTDRMLYINPAECIDCGACQPACPVSAIFPEGDVPADQSRFIEINSLWYEDPAAARAQVGGGAAPAAAPAPAAEAATAEASEAPAAEASGEAPAAEAPAAEAAPAPAAAAAPPPQPKPAPAGTYKFGENGVEGKCALCGTYVIKSGIPYGRKSVLCPDCAAKQTRLLEQAGRR